MSATSYAVSAKARAKFGKFLTDRDYTNILSCQSVAEVMVYLKTHTHFSRALSEVSENEVHRGWLEMLLRQYLFYEFDSLCRYDSGLSAGFSRYVVERTEVEQIVRFLILLNSNSTEKFIFQFPAYLDKHSDLEISKLAVASNYDEFLDALTKTPYYEILKQFSPDKKGRLPVSEIENKLYEHITGDMHTLIEKQSKGSERRELTDIFRRLNDYSMVSRILRMKRYYHLEPSAIRASLMPEYGSISPKMIDRMCEAETAEEVYRLLGHTGTGKLLKRNADENYAGDNGVRLQYILAKNYLHFSNNPSVVMISFVFLSETELMNVITLIEGVRYRMDTKTIQSLLIR
ncbi:MAG: V-type ATPase subunit [Ruminococcus sp.]|nr:V-type ATPase subunit [Ruminococcus sp.]